MKDNAPIGPDMEEERDDAVIGVAFRYSMFGVVSLLMIAGAIALVLRWMKPSEVTEVALPVSLPTYRESTTRDVPKIPMVDITTSAGIEFVHFNGANGEKLLPETMGGGCAFFDYNNDGHPDILFVNSKPWSHDQANASDGDKNDPTLSLYENDGKGFFMDVTAKAGLDVSLYGQGCAIGDFDNDGDADIFITAVSEGNELTGPNRLFRNDDGKFVDVTRQAGVAGDVGDWGSSCGWFDFDNDGDLDFWVCNYVDWSREYDLAQNFRLTGGERAYGRPQAFGGSYSKLFRNDDDGKFTDISEKAGIRVDAASTGSPQAKSLGLAFHDFDQDGNLDVLVANDTVQNHLFRNRGDGTFQEMASIAGVAFDAEGNARGAMGIDVACARDEHGCACVAIGNFANEMSAFYVSAPNSFVFSDQAVANGLGPSTRLFLTFAVFFLDIDLNGWQDIFHANGHLEQDISKVQASQTYEQAPQLFWNAGPEAMTEYVALPIASTGESFAKPLVGRGASYADIDGDGDLDLLIATAGADPRLLRNDQSLGNHWLRMKLVGNGTTSNRDAIGAKVEVQMPDGRSMVKVVSPTRGYLSQVELPVTFGLGETQPARVVIIWPDGAEQEVKVDEVDKHYVIEQAAS